MHVSRACGLLLIGGCMAACAAPRAPGPVAAPLQTPTGTAADAPASKPAPPPEPRSTAAVDSTSAGHTLTGAWGGLHVLLTLSPDGGRIQYDCAQGTLDAPVRPDARGGFHVRGQHIQQQGGPARVADQPPAPQRATYDGAVSGDRMQLRVSSNGEEIGSYVLQRGADPQMVNCL